MEGVKLSVAAEALGAIARKAIGDVPLCSLDLEVVTVAQGRGFLNIDNDAAAADGTLGGKPGP
jgi:hypothetical protein